MKFTIFLQPTSCHQKDLIFDFDCQITNPVLIKKKKKMEDRPGRWPSWFWSSSWTVGSGYHQSPACSLGWCSAAFSIQFLVAMKEIIEIE